MSVLAAILAISLIIIVHEAGHYVVAKWCKMRVDRFSIGFGPAIARWKRGETKFQLAPIPFGGYVEIRGMNIAEEVDPNDPYAYPNRPTWQRFLTILAGPATNYLFAIFLAFLLFMTVGVPGSTARYVVSGVTQGFDAHGKIEPGDVIVSIQRPGDPAPVPVYHRVDGNPPAQPLKDLVHASGGAAVQVKLLRDGSERTLELLPRQDPEAVDEKTGEKLYRLGIMIEEERVDVGLLGAIAYSFEFPIEQTKLNLVHMYKMITGEVKGELTGPVGITHAFTEVIDVGGWIKGLELLVLFNVLVGLFNLLPIPALDGGRLVFLVYEMATRRRPNPRFEATVHMVGIMLLLLVLVVVTIKDIARWIG
jgi:regulator of sigma E protease